MDTTAPTKLLVICTANKLRSQTMEAMLQQTPGFELRSAGTNPCLQGRPITRQDINWCDQLVIFESFHWKELHRRFPGLKKPILNFDIPDEYEAFDPALMVFLKARFALYFDARLRDPSCNQGGDRGGDRTDGEAATTLARGAVNDGGDGVGLGGGTGPDAVGVISGTDSVHPDAVISPVVASSPVALALLRGKVIAMTKLGGGTNETHLIEFADGRKAVWKPVSGEAAHRRRTRTSSRDSCKIE